MADHSPELLYRAPTEAAAVTVTLTVGSVLQGHLHLHADASTAGGFESVQHLLDEAEPFFAVTLHSGRVVLVGKAHVVDVRCSLPVGDPLPGSTVHGIKAVLSTGVTVTGLVRWSAPPAHDRVIDVLNASRFLRFATDDGFVYVNSAHICAAYPQGLTLPQLDKFLKAAQDHGAEALVLEVGAPASLLRGGKGHALGQQSVTETQVWGLIQELATGEDARRLAAQEPVAFEYASPSGPVAVSVEVADNGVTAILRPLPVDAGDPVAAGATGTTAGVGHDKAKARIDELLLQLVRSGASDLHLRVDQPTIFRRDGRLVRDGVQKLGPGEIQAMLDAIAPERDRLKHAQTGDADFAYEIAGTARFRVNAAMDRGGAMAVFRVIPTDVPTCEQLQISREVQNLTMLTKGLVLVTGPTGSGKSTTLAALVNKMNIERDDHILTIEDPIEFVHPSKKCLVTHRQVGQHTESFKAGLRAALREDPDIVLIGELRDLETVAIAIETAETGHLVFGTLHTTTAASTVDRIIDQFPSDRQAQIRVMLSESLRGVISQTLCKKIGGGRVAAREILLTTSAISNLIREGKTFQIPSIMQTSRKVGMVTLNDALLDLVDKKLVEPREAYMKSTEKIMLVTTLKARGYDVSFATGP